MMTFPINSFPAFNESPGALGEPAAARPGTDSAVNFERLLLDSLGETSRLDQEAQAAIGRRIAGEDITQVEVFSAVKKADLSLRMMMQIRNKLIDAWQEIQQLRM